MFYISLLAKDNFGRPIDEYFTFDEASKLDLKETGVIVLDVHLLFRKYRIKHPELDEKALKGLTVYELVEDLMDEYPKASYFLDECPFIESSPNWWKLKLTRTMCTEGKLKIDILVIIILVTLTQQSQH